MTDVVRTRAELAANLAAVPGTTAVVMTMGALHAGHEALLRAARERADHVTVTIFVNPLQFGPNEDLDRYPRTLDADLALCRSVGVDLVFAPAAAELYPAGQPMVRVDPGSLGNRFEGASRPGFFTGVLTVVLKLINLVRPDLAFFGEKDYQQLTLVRRMVQDLELDVEIVGVPTVREPDGLAMSSRNRYLDATERAAAVRLSAALRTGAAAGGAGHGADAVLAAAHRAFADPADRDGGAHVGTGTHPGTGATEVKLDYLELTGPDLGPAPETGPARLLIAAWVGGTRLIDNLAVELAPPGNPDSATRPDPRRDQRRPH